jgi:hypothetical protein
MLLDLVGGGMNVEPDWALTVAELEALGLDERGAKLAAGVPPSFDLDGRWVVLVDDEPYNPTAARVFEISGGKVTCSRGACGEVVRLRRKALIRFAPQTAGGMEECISISTAPATDYLYGTVYIGADLPEGDPSVLWQAAGDHGDDTLPMAEAVWLYREEIAGARLGA